MSSLRAGQCNDTRRRNSIAFITAKIRRRTKRRRDLGRRVWPLRIDNNTGNVFIDALAAYSFLDIGGDRNITYTFATGGNISAHDWNPLTEKAQWQIALQQWVNVANITAQEVFTPDADLREAWVDTGQMTAAHGLGPDGLAYPSYHDLPQSGGGGPNGMYNRGYNTSFFPAAGVTTGGSGYWAFLHEIGRGLGLTPPFGTTGPRERTLVPRRHRVGGSGRLRL